MLEIFSLFQSWIRNQTLLQTQSSSTWMLLFSCLQLHNTFDQAAGEVLSSILHILTKQTHFLLDSSPEHMLVYSLVAHISTCHLWNQHSKAANAPHRQQLKQRNKQPFSFFPFLSFALSSQAAKDLCLSWHSCHAEKKKLSPSPSSRVPRTKRTPR